MTLTIPQLSKHAQHLSFRAEGEGPPLVLIHGVGLQSAAWGPQIAALAPTHRVIALDMPGHGGCAPLSAGARLPEYVAWCSDAIEMLGLGAVNLVGHSMGALIAGGVAIERPDLVQRVAVLNGVFRRDHSAKAAVIARALEICGGQIDVGTPLARWFDDAQQAERAQVCEWLSGVDPVGYAMAYTAFAHGDATYAEQFQKISQPFLAMTGDGDPNSTPEMSRAMAASVALGCFVVIKGHRHMINLTAPDEVNAHLKQWLAQPLPSKDVL